MTAIQNIAGNHSLCP